MSEADVFITNLRGPALVKAGLDYETLAARHPALVYASVSGYGLDGAEANRASFDVGAFWARAGVAHSLTQEGDAPPLQRGGMGDHMAALAIAGGVAAALASRSHTGTGQLVSTSLMRIGGYMMSWDLSTRLRHGEVTAPATRTAIPNPLMNPYRARDGKWFWLLCLQADRHWPDVVRAVRRPDLLDNPRFADIEARTQHATELVKLLDDVFIQQDLAAWADALDREGVWWAPVQSVDDVVTDPQAADAGLFVDVPSAQGAIRMPATPVDFSVTNCDPRATAPELGQHTEEILLELGHDWDQIAALANEGIIP